MYDARKALPIKGFPLIFRDTSWRTSNLHSPAMLDKLVRQLSPQKAYFIYNDNGEFTSKALDEGFAISDLHAINFPTWIDNSFNKKEVPPTSKLLYIYNVGMEIGKTGFSDTILNSIIVNNLNKGNITIVASNTITHTTFKQGYPSSSKHIELGRQILK